MVIPDGVTVIKGYEKRPSHDPYMDTLEHSIHIGPFSERDVQSITLPQSVKCISKGAFDSCESLTSITIPDSVTSIGKWAFSRCFMLTIRAPQDSYAARYAKENRNRFEEI